MEPGKWRGPWLTPQAMWTNFIRHIGDEGTPVRDLQAMACLSEPAIKSRLHHLEWWRYLTFAPAPDERRAKPRYRDLLVHLTPEGRLARDAWKPLNALVDKRWWVAVNFLSKNGFVEVSADKDKVVRALDLPPRWLPRRGLTRTSRDNRRSHRQIPARGGA